MDIYYLSSGKKIIDLMSDTVWLENPELLLDCELEYEITSSYSGYSKVKEVYEEPKEKKLKFKISADSEDEFNSIVGQIEQTIIADGLMGKIGRIYWNDSYKEVMYIKRELDEYTEFAQYVIMEITFLLMDQKWTKEMNFSYKPIASSGESLKLPFMLPQVLPVTAGSTNSINLDHYITSDFVMKAYGPFSTFLVTIAEHPYTVSYTVDEGEILVIDSRATADMDRRCYLIKSDGSEVNLFNYRGSELFEKIPGDAITLEYTQTFGLDLTVFVKAGDPTWI